MEWWQEDEIQIAPGITVDGERFRQIFQQALPNPDYDTLVLIDGGKLGYKEFFDRLKEEGILS